MPIRFKLQGNQMKYEFRGKTLSEVVAKSTGRCAMKADAGQQGNCQQLSRWIDQLDREIGDMENEIERLSDNLSRLRSSRRDSIEEAIIGAAVAVAGPLASASRALRTARNALRRGGVGLGDVVSALPYVGGLFITVRNGLQAYSDTREINAALRELDQIERVLNVAHGTARELQVGWRQNRCDRFF